MSGDRLRLLSGILTCFEHMGLVNSLLCRNYGSVKKTSAYFLVNCATVDEVRRTYLRTQSKDFDSKLDCGLSSKSETRFRELI